MRKQLLSLILIISLGTESFAQVEITPSLHDAIQKAIEKSYTLKNKKLDIDKINLQKKGVWNTYIPRIEASASYVYFDNEITVDVPTTTIPFLNLQLFDGKRTFESNGNLFNASILAKSVLFSGLQIPNAAKALEQKIIGSNYLMEANKDDIIKEVITTFDQLSLLDQVEKLILDSEKRLDVESLRINKAIEQGLAVPYDRDKIKLASLELQSKKIELHGKRQLVYKKITYLTGYTKEQTTQVQAPLEPYTILNPETLTTEQKSELKALEAFGKAYEYLLKKEKGSYLPKVAAFGGYTYTSLFNSTITTPQLPIINSPTRLSLNEATIAPNWILGVGLKWEIFSGFEREHKTTEAKINIESNANQLSDAREKLELLLEKNKVDYYTLNQKIEVGQQQKKVTENNLTLAVKQYKEGLINISERLEAENDNYKAALNYISNLIEQRQAAIETIQTTGQLANYAIKN
ncbi:TolC family protein [Flavobacterium sp. '19STA2R22 D10 B1']|uniref:TolC family protein n=1 Tax=Flavobacterium aerium TaxID=3037261 RepID=UPI00278BAE6B|nr:TolC family protein [Flavobacterium sp. '19STA2R22 D10 B1']